MLPGPRHKGLTTMLLLPAIGVTLLQSSLARPGDEVMRFLAVEPNVLSSPCHRVGVPVFLFPQHEQDGQCAMSAVVRIASVRVAGSTHPPTGPIQC